MTGHFSKQASWVAVYLDCAVMDSRTVFVLLWMLLSTSTGIKLDGDGYVDIIIAIGAKVSENNRLIDNIKVNMHFKSSVKALMYLIQICICFYHFGLVFSIFFRHMHFFTILKDATFKDAKFVQLLMVC